MSFAVVEKFISVNGEGSRAGELAVFIRFRKCNLNCAYCDTKWANSEEASAAIMSAEEIAEYVRETGVKNVTLTGGEPLLQEELYSLIEALMKQGNSVEIETNGSISIEKLCGKLRRPIFTLDYKLPCSGMEAEMVMENYDLIEKNDVVKFVCGGIGDLKKAAEIIEKYDLINKCHVYLSPVFGMIEAADMVDFMVKNKMNGVRLQLQIHKFIWDPEKRGV